METRDAPSMSMYVNAIKRRRRLMAGIFLLVASVAIMSAFALPSIYSATALIRIEEEKVSSVTGGSGDGIDSFLEQYVNSLGISVLSAKNLGTLISELNPYPEGTKGSADAAAQLKDDTETKMIKSTILDPGSGRDREIITAFSVSYSNPDPNVAAKVTQRLAHAYIAADRTNKLDKAAQEASFYGDEAERINTQIQGLESKLANFKGRNYGSLPEMAAVNQGAIERTQMELDRADDELGTLRQQRVFLAQKLVEEQSSGADTAQLSQLQEEYNRKSTTYDKGHPDMIALRRQIQILQSGGNMASGNSLQAQLDNQRAILAQTLQRYSEGHPDVRKLERTIKGLEERIANGEKTSNEGERTAGSVQLQTQINAIDIQLSSLTQRSQELRGKLKDAEARVESSPLVEKEYANLTKDLSLAKEKYAELLGRRMNAEVSGSAISSGKADEFKLLNEPRPPTRPSKPNRLLIITFGVFVGALLAATAAIFTEVVDPAVRNSDDVRMLLSISPIAFIPTIKNSQTRRQQRTKYVVFCSIFVVGMPLLYMLISLLT